jgi:hypothetical protein
MVVGDQDADPAHIRHSRTENLREEEVLDSKTREKIRKLLVTGDNRLKQGVDPEKARQSFLQALEVAREAGAEDEVRPLVEIRLADLERLAREAPPPAEPEA